MERTRYTAVLTFAFLMLLSPACVAQQKTISDTEKLLLDSANRERTDRGLPLLTWDEALARAARKHAELMAEQDALAHQLPDERDTSFMPRPWEMKGALDLVTADFLYVPWLGNRKGIEEQTTAWNKTVIERQDDLKGLGGRAAASCRG